MTSHKASPTHTGLLTKAVQSYPDKWDLSPGKFEISPSCLQKLDTMLRSAGVSPGNVVVLPFPNSIKLVIMLLADSNGYPLAQAAASKLGITQVTVSLPDLTGLVHNFLNDPSDGVLHLHNSGTTSQPKVIPLTPHNLAALVQSIPSVYRMTDSDSTVMVLPLFYVHGFLAGLLSPLSAGGSVTLASLGQFSDDPEANEATFLSGWFHTGHLGYLNEDGYLHLVDRIKELINNGAHAGSFQVERITVDVGVPISVPALDVGVPINVELEVPEVDPELGLGNQTSLPESSEQNTLHIEGIAGPDPLSVPNGSNGIWHLRYITACNFVSNATVGVLYLGKKLQGCNDTYQMAELIASVGVPIAVAAGTFVASFLFASDTEKWSNWISGMSMINAGMTVGGPLSFNSVRIEN